MLQIIDLAIFEFQLFEVFVTLGTKQLGFA